MLQVLLHSPFLGLCRSQQQAMGSHEGCQDHMGWHCSWGWCRAAVPLHSHSLLALEDSKRDANAEEVHLPQHLFLLSSLLPFLRPCPSLSFASTCQCLIWRVSMQNTLMTGRTFCVDYVADVTVTHLLYGRSLF